MESSCKTTKDLIADGIKALSAQLEAGNSEALTMYLSAMGRFHTYSFGNQMAIAMQKPNAIRVAGFQTWKTLGRNVKKGEKAIRILAPMVFGKSGKDAAANDDSVKPHIAFRGVCVFDVAQTEGKALPEFASVSGDAGDALAKLLVFAESQTIGIEFADDLQGAMGLSYGGRIKILSGQTDAETVATLIHELAHELLHKGAQRAESNKTSRELEAEAVAYIVGSSIGLTMSTSSADYIKLYNGNSDMLGASLAAISHASTLILKAITLPVKAISPILGNYIHDSLLP